MAEPINIRYKAEPTLAKFHQSDSYFRGVMGPVGSGKSVACSMEVWLRGIRQAAYSGVRKTRFAIIRNSYPELKTTTLKTFQQWFKPYVIADYNMGPPIHCNIKKGLPDGTVAEIEVYFIAVDRPDQVDKLLSLELTGAWINEVRALPREVLDILTTRIGRYPGEIDGGGPSWTGIWTDTNPPDNDHWYYDLAETERPRGYEFFKQPPAMIRQGDYYVPNTGQIEGIPPAENVRNLEGGFDYYVQMIPGKRPEWVKVYVEGEYGTVFSGRPVYSQYNDMLHLSPEPLEAYRGSPVTLGWDFGRGGNAVVFMQLSNNGQLRVLDELLSIDMGIRDFVNQVVKPFIANKYPPGDFELYSWGDPAGMSKAVTSEDSCIKIVSEEGIRTRPAKSNDPVARQDAVHQYLSRMSGNQQAFILSPNCDMLRKGFNGAYHFKRMNIATSDGDVRFKDVPEKNIYSHPHDALQYGAMMLKPDFQVKSRTRTKKVKKVNFKAWS